MRKNHESEIVEGDIFSSNVVEGVETNIYGDKDRGFFAAMEGDQRGPFYIHPYRELAYDVSEERKGKERSPSYQALTA